MNHILSYVDRILPSYAACIGFERVRSPCHLSHGSDRTLSFYNKEHNRAGGHVRNQPFKKLLSSVLRVLPLGKLSVHPYHSCSSYPESLIFYTRDYSANNAPPNSRGLEYDQSSFYHSLHLYLIGFLLSFRRFSLHFREQKNNTFPLS